MGGSLVDANKQERREMQALVTLCAEKVTPPAK